MNVRDGLLTWDQTEGFVREGYALIFGSVQTDGSPVVWHNPLGLDNTEPAHRYSPREIQVPARVDPVGDGGLQITPAVADFVAPISGIGRTDLQKTGRGTLKLSAANTFTGATLVNEGTLALAGAGAREACAWNAREQTARSSLRLPTS